MTSSSRRSYSFIRTFATALQQKTSFQHPTNSLGDSNSSARYVLLMLGSSSAVVLTSRAKKNSRTLLTSVHWSSTSSLFFIVWSWWVVPRDRSLTVDIRHYVEAFLSLYSLFCLQKLSPILLPSCVNCWILLQNSSRCPSLPHLLHLLGDRQLKHGPVMVVFIWVSAVGSLYTLRFVSYALVNMFWMAM